nr:ribosome silencing factor [Ardenticatena sp.]
MTDVKQQHVAPDAAAIARTAVDAAEDRKGSNIVLIDVRGQSPITDYFVIATGESDRQLRALSKAIEDRLREDLGAKPFHREGEAETGWILLDYVDVVIHLFSPEQRAYYQLEALYENAPVVLRIQ